jgi:transcriptional regulator with XRE-family HTH domain
VTALAFDTAADSTPIRHQDASHATIDAHNATLPVRPPWALLLAEFRISGEWTVRQVAKASGLHPRTLFRLENTEILPPSRFVLMALAHGLGMDEREEARLLTVAGYLPADATVRAVVWLVVEGALPAAHVERFRQQVEAVRQRYAVRVLAAGQEGTGQ